MPVESHQIILQYALEWYTIVQPNSTISTQSLISLHWNPPSTGTCKINTDGSRSPTSGSIGAGGLLRDTTGEWIKGFSVNLGNGSVLVLEAELWSILWGLTLAWDSGYRNVEVESDSCDAVSLLNSPTIPTHPLFSIIVCCKSNINKDWRCSINHIYREQNVAVDALSSRSIDFGPGIHLFETVPDFLKDILYADAMGVSKHRLVAA
ncbi:unnamed protein product [Prunus armeniaca]